jgi:autotransporter-associated beta strand protein
MIPLWLRSLAKTWSRTPARRPARRAPRPLAEALEDRLAPATLHWIGATSSNWSAATNWAENAFPANGDTVVFDTTQAGFAGTAASFLPANDLSGLTLGGMVINDSSGSGDFTISGNPVTLTGNITHALNLGTATTISITALNASPTATADLTISNTAGKLNVSSNMDLGGWQLTVDGAGTTTLGGVMAGTTTGVIQSSSLIEGRSFLNGGFDETSTNPGGLFTAGPVMGQISTVVNPAQAQSAHTWSDNTTWIYTGQFFDDDGFFSFAENIDDNVLVKIDGVTRLRDTTWNNPTTTGAPAAGYGMGPAGDGWHDIEIRLGNGGGGAGPVAGNGWTSTFGFGLRDSTTNLTSTNGADYVVPPAVRFRVPNHNAIVKTGSGTLNITNPANTYAGPTKVNAGLLVVGADGALGSTAGNTVVADGASLTFANGLNYATAEPVSVTGTGLGGGGAIGMGLTAGSTTATFGGPVTLAGPATVAAAAGTGLTLTGAVGLGANPLTVAGAGNTTLSGVISDAPPAPGMVAGLSGQFYAGVAGDPSLLDRSSPNYLGTKTPAATATVSQFNFPSIDANSFAPYANVGTSNIGALFTGKINIPVAGNYSFRAASDDGSVVDIDTTRVVNNNFSQGAPGNAPNGTITGLTAGLHDITIGYWQGGGGASLVVSWDPTGGTNFVPIPATALIAPGPAVTVATTGAGTATLSGNNTYAGATQVRSGTLVAGANNALGTTAGNTTVSPGGTLAFAGGLNYSTAEPVTAGGAGAGGAGAVANVSGANSFAGPVTLAGNTTFGSAAGTLTLSGTVDMGTGGSLTTTGAGNLTITGAVTGQTPTGLLTGGLFGQYYTLPATTNMIQVGDPTFIGNQTPAATALTPLLNFPNISGNSFTDSTGHLDANVGTSNVEGLWTGFINITTAGTYQFESASDDGSMVYIDGTAVVNNNFFQGAPGNAPFGTANLTVGLHAITVTYMQGGGGASLVVQWDPTNTGNYVDIPSSALSTPVNNLTAAGTGTLTLAGNNTYGGLTTVSSGTLVAAANNALGGTALGTKVAAGATLGFAGNVNYSTAEPVTLTGAGVGGNGALLNVSGTNTFAGPVTLAGGTTLGSTAGTLTLSGPFAVGPNVLTVTGAGNVAITGPLTSPTAAPGLVEGRITTNGFDETTPNPGGLTQPGVTMGQISSVTNPAPAQSAHQWSDNTTWIYTGQFFDADGQFAFAENIDDNVLVKIDGVTRLRNTTWNEPTTTGSTTSQATGNTSANPNGGTTNFGMGPAGDGWHDIEIRLGNGGGGAGPVAGNGWTGTFGFGLRDSTTNLTSTTGTDYVTPLDPGNGTLFRTTNPGLVVKTGTGTLTLSGANTGFGGGIQVNGGSVVAAANDALGNTGFATTVNPGGSLGFDTVVYTTPEPVTLAGGTIAAANGNSTFLGPVTVTAAGTLSAPAGTSIALAGVVSGSAGLTKTGAGTVSLNGTNTFTGPTTVSAGTLLVNGVTAGSAFAVNSGGTLGDAGNSGVAGPVNAASGGTVAPGGVGTAGLLTTGNASFAAGSNLSVDIGGTSAGTGGYDQLNVAGTVAVGGNLNVTIPTGFTPAWNTVYRLVNNDGTDAITGTFASVNGVAATLTEGSNFAVGPYTFKISYAGGTGNDLTLTVQDVVAPASTITTPSGTTPFRTATWPGSISGTAADAPPGGSGVSAVTVTVLQGATTLFTFTPALTVGAWTVPFPASNFPADGTYTIRVRSTDAAGNAETTTTAANTVTVVIDNTPPAAPVITGIFPDTGSSSSDGITKAQNIFLLGTAEPGSTVTVTRTGLGVIGTTTTDNLGNWTFDYTGTTLAPGGYSFTATATDTAGNVGGASAARNVTVDTTAPQVVSVNRVGGPLTNAAAVQFTVTFNDNVTGVDTTDFAAVVGGSTTGAAVTGVSGSGSTYTVTVGTGSGDGSVGLNALNDGTVQDLAGNPLSGATFTGQVFTIDKSPPTVTAVNRFNPAGASTNLPSVQFQVVFSESVTGVDAGDFTLTASGLTGATISNVSGSGTTYTVTVNGYSGNGTLRLDVTDNDSIVDGSGNPLGGPGAGNGSFTAGQVYTIDSTPPSVSSIVRAGSDPTNATSVTYTVTFSESVTGVDTTDFALTTSGLSGASVAGVTGTGATYTVTVNTGSGSGTVRLDLLDDDSIADLAGNKLGGTGVGNGNFTTGQVYSIDKTPPTVSSIVRAAASPTNAASIPFTVTFSEAVTGVDASDFTLTTTGIAAAAVTGVSGSGTTYTVTVSTGVGTGTIRLDLTDDDTIRDAATNPLGGVGTGNGNFTAGQVYSVDTVPPVVQSVVATAANPTNAATVTYAVTFSEAVTGVDATDFALTTTGLSGASVTGVAGSGATYTVTVNTGSGTGTLRLDVADDDSILDAVTNPLGGVGTGNGNFTAGQVYSVDKTPPVVNSIVRAGASPTNATAVAFTVTFSETVTGVDASDFALAATGLTGAAILGVTGGGMTYTVTVNNYSGAGTLGLNLLDDDSIADAATNPLGGPGAGNGNFTGQVYSVDRIPPTVASINRVAASPTNAASVQFTVTFSEAVTGVDATDFALTTTGVSGASVGTVTGSGTTYTVTVNTGSGDGTVRLDVADDDSITDAVGNPLGGVGAGNGNFISGQVYTIDKTPPVVGTIVRAASDPTNAASVTYTVTFSEPVTGVDATDFTLTPTGGVTGASVTNVTGSGAVYTVTVNTGTGTGSGTLRLDVTDNDSIQDLATNPLGGVGVGNGNFTTGQAYTVDRLPPTVTSITRLNPSPTNANSVQYQVVFSEAVTGVDSSDFVITPSGIAAAVVTGVSGSGSTYTVTVSTGAGSGTIRLDLTDDDTIKDLATNPLGGVGVGNGNFTTGQVYAVDKVSPTVSTITKLDGDPTLAPAVHFQVVFSEAVTGVDAGDFALTTTGVSGASVGAVTGSGTTYTVTVNTGTGSTGTIRLDVVDNDSVTDLVGNPLGGVGAGNGNFTTGPAYTVDRLPPTVSSISLAAASPTVTATVPFTVTFSEPVTGVDATDFVATPSGLTAAGAITNVTGSGTTWTVTVNTGSGSGTIGLNLVDDDTIADLAGNKLGGAGTGNGNFAGTQTYTLDRTPPVVTALTRVEASPTNLSLVHYAVTFSKSVTGVDPSDFTLTPTGGVSGAVVTGVSGSGTDWTVAVSTGSGTGTVEVDLTDDDTITDSAGNPLGGTGAGNGDFAGPAFAVDKTAPGVASVVPTTGSPTNAGTVRYAVTFTEAVTGVDATDFAVTTSGGVTGASVASVTGSGTAYTVTVNTGTGDGTVGLTALNDGTIQDLATNPLAGPDVAGPPVTIDKTPPQVVPFTPPPKGLPPTDSASASFTVTFTEAVTGVDVTDFAVTGVAGAAVTGVTGSGATYTVSVDTGTGDGTLSVQLVDDDSITDAAGNPLGGTGAGNGSATVGMVSLDRTPPAVAGIGLADANPTGNGLVHFTVTFTEPVTGVNLNDFTLTAAGLTDAKVIGVDGGGAVYAVTVATGTGKGTLRLDAVPDASVTDAAGNGLATGFTSGPDYTVTPASTGGGGTTPTVRVPAVVAGAETGSSFVTVYDSAGKVLSTFLAYDPSFQGGVRVTLGDINGDGIPDVITGAGPGGGPHVKVIDGTKLNLLSPDGEISDAAVLYTFQAYPDSFRGGVYVAAGDINGDGRADVVTGAGDTGGPAVTVFSGKDGSQMYSLMVYNDDFRGGVTVAVGDVTGDGHADIIAGTGPGGGPAVVVVDGSTREVVGTFFAFDPNFRGGVNVAAGDLNGDGVAEIIAGAGLGGGPIVGIFSGPKGAPVGSFNAAGRAGGQVNGIRVATADVTGDGKTDILAAGGPGSDPSTARVYDAVSLRELDLYFATDPAFVGGVYVGGD